MLKGNNLASVSWGDHLVFGEGDGKLNTSEALENRLGVWKQELGVAAVLWRETRANSNAHYFSGKGLKKKPLRRPVDWDDFEDVPNLCHNIDLKAYLYVTLFDEGWPLMSRREREVSYHNAMHMQHWSRQSRFTRGHPEYVVCDRSQTVRQWGIPCLAYPRVREHYIRRYLDLLEGYNFDGLFLCLRSQSKPADFGDQFGFNEPVREDYLKRYGRDIWSEDFDLSKWRDLQGEYLTTFLSELKQALQKRNLSLGLGIPRGDVIGPPLGNWTLHWQHWLQKNVVDDFAINQNSSQCPSMWHNLWPMHRGYGYTQNYIDGKGMPSIETQLQENYLPALNGSRSNLYLARQWLERDSAEEEHLVSHPAVSGLVFSTFRFDNPEAVKRGDWHA
jgi:hypothetical protein